MAHTLKVRGLIIRQVNYGDYNKMLTVLTEEYGKISVSARGVRSMKNKNRAACDLLCFDEFVLSAARGEVYNLSQCECIENFFHLQSDCVRLALGVYMADVAGHLAPEDMAGALKLLLNSLYILQDETTDVTLVKLIYDSKLLLSAGFAPEVGVCVNCQRKQGPFTFSAAAGGTVCAACGAAGLPLLSMRTVSFLRYILESPLSRTLYKIEIDAPTLKESAACVEEFMAVHISERLHTLEYFKKLVKM